MTMQTVLLVLLYAFAALTVLDCVSTYQALKDGRNSEGNPLVRALIKKLGLTGGLVASAVLPLAAVFWYISTQPPGSTLEVIAFAALDLLYIVTVIGNFKIARG